MGDEDLAGPYWTEVVIVNACRCILQRDLDEYDDIFDHLDAIRWATSAGDT